MNRLYGKIAITSVCTALCFALGANKEAKAATIILSPVTSFGVTDQDLDGIGDSYYTGTPFHVGLSYNQAELLSEERAFYEFNINNLSLASTVISSAIFRVRFNSVYAGHRYHHIDIFGYLGNGQPDASDFSRDFGGGLGAMPPLPEYLSYLDSENPIYLTGTSESGPFPVQKFNFYEDFPITPLFVNELIKRDHDFAGFSVRESFPSVFGEATLDNMDASLIITTVPEPTTIFGSALALGVGGWLKRKKSSQHKKTASQH
jgi:hypothetical protein